jgi:hypothetical protein
MQSQGAIGLDEVQDVPGKPVRWEFRFSGCESGTGSVPGLPARPPVNN